MEVNVRVYCGHCHREGILKIKLGTTTKQLEEEYSCIHCETKGKLKHLGQ